MTRWIDHIEQLIIQWWWVVLWVLVCIIGYERVHTRKQVAANQLSSQITQLMEERSQNRIRQAQLQRQIQSQSDPAWVELTLMRGLGLVPEGQIKIFFHYGEGT